MKKNITIKYLIITFFVLYNALSLTSYGQAVNPNDLKNIKVDQLSDAQITSLLKSAEEKGMTQEQLETLAISKGMPVSEIQKLKSRIEKLKSTDRSALSEGTTNREFEFIVKEDDLFNELSAQRVEDSTELTQLQKIYGYSLFNNKKLTFEPSLNIPTPENYQIGPGDEIIINVWGASQQNYNLLVNPEGNIIITDLGPVYVNGLSIEKATSKIKSRLSSIYSGLSGNYPNTYAQVSLGNLRSIKVNITGEAYMPGTYTLPSLASVFNALYYAGGPGINGSFRNIKVIRNNQEIAVIDLYEFMQNGISQGNIVLQDQDVVYIPAYKIRVELKGEIKRPGIYEILETEHFYDLIKYCGSFTKDAYLKNITILRNTDREKMLTDISQGLWETFLLRNGDIITVEPVIDRFANRVEIRGAVYRQGIFELNDGLTLKKLIEKADGLREDAFMERAVIYRLQENNKTEVISVDLKQVISDNANDILLQREDIISIFSIFDLEEQYNVQVLGEVQFPGTYPFYESMKLGEIIAMSGGLKESASLAKIEIARRIKNKNALTPGINIADLFTFSITEKLEINDSALQFILTPYDVVFIRKSPGYQKQEYVSINGEVAFPGTYSLLSKDERISDLIKQAGGFNNEAYIKGAKLKRIVIANDDERLKALKSIKRESDDSTQIEIMPEKEKSIGIELEKIIRHPKSKYDLILREGDILEIPKLLQTVTLNGAFLYPVTVRFDNTKNFRFYISSAGGFAKDAMKSKTYVLYANGSVKRTHSFVFIRNFPKIDPGAEIIVPRKPEKEKISVQESISLGSMFTSTSLIIVTLIKELKTK